MEDYKTKVKTGVETGAKQFASGMSEAMMNLIAMATEEQAGPVAEVKALLEKQQTRVENLAKLVEEQSRAGLNIQQKIAGLNTKLDAVTTADSSFRSEVSTWIKELEKEVDAWNSVRESAARGLIDAGKSMLREKVESK